MICWVKSGQSITGPWEGSQKHQRDKQGTSRDNWESKGTGGSKAEGALRQSALGACAVSTKVQINIGIKEPTQPEITDTEMTLSTMGALLVAKSAVQRGR